VTCARVVLTQGKCRDPGSYGGPSLMLSQLSYGGFDIAEKDCCAVGRVLWVGIGKQDATQDGQRRTGCDERAMGLTIGISIYIYICIYIYCPM